jgi:insulin-like growth factor 2 mRNA-binding protein 1
MFGNHLCSEVMLKMLADDRYCGRIIGKEGKMIKKIREDTGTKITVSK